MPSLGKNHRVSFNGSYDIAFIFIIVSLWELGYISLSRSDRDPFKASAN